MIREGSCREGLGCPAPLAGYRSCTLCGKVYRFCKAHKSWAITCMNGHFLRVHPEFVSDSDIDKVIDNEVDLRGIREQYKQSPDLWEKLVDRIDARIEVRKAEGH